LANWSYPGRNNLENLGHRWGIRNANKVVSQVFDAVHDWKEEFASADVPEKDIIRFKEIDSHLQE
jgi:hypothetical protein